MSMEAYIQAEAQIHVAAQVIALTGKNLIEPQADDSQTTAVWHAERQLLIGRDFSSNGNQFAVFVDPLDFAIGIHRNGAELDRVHLDGLTYLQCVDSWRKWLSTAGIANALDLTLHYALPETANYAFDVFDKPSEVVLSRWSTNRTMANQALRTLSETVGSPSDVNIWPHHFDSGTYYELHKTNGVTDRSIGAGFNPADAMVPEPYFYISGWHKDQSIDYADTPTMENGQWILDDWKGAVLPITYVKDPSAVREFFTTTASFLMAKLT